MPGITGIISADPTDLPLRQVRGMVDAMRHESFYSAGSLRDARAGVAAGWCVHENSFASRNALWNDRGDVCLILAGEDFSDPDEVRSSCGGGAASSLDGPGYLLGWYEALGPELIERLNGNLCGLIIDRRHDLVLLFNDRFGLNRLYLHEGPEGTYFSSEAKSILRAVPRTRRLDPHSLAQFASCGCVLQNRSLYEGVFLLPPASRWTFSRGRLVRKETYFRPESWEQLPPLDEEAYYECLKTVFPRIVRRYFRGSAKVGMSLTGGLDGRMIMACSDPPPGSLPCYTFGGPYRDCVDATLARQIAQVCGQSHQVIRVDDRFLSQFGTLAEKAVYVSDGAMDVTGAVELFANAQARTIAPVRMTGNYGSEVLRANVAFKAQPLDPVLFSPDFIEAGRQASETYRQEANIPALSFITTKQTPWHHHSRLAVEQSLVTMRSPYLDNDLIRLAYQSPKGQETSKLPALRFVHDFHEGLSRLPTDRGLLHRRTPVRSPWAHYWQEFTFRAEYAYDHGMPDWLARLDRSLMPLRPERLFLGRHKFYHFRVWYRDKLGGYLRQVLLDPRSLARSHLGKGRLEKMLAEHLAGTHNHTVALHQALSIELIHRQLLERRWESRRSVEGVAA